MFASIAVIVWLLLAGVSIYAGATGWSLLSAAGIALLMALNKAALKTRAEDIVFPEAAIRAAINLPIMLIIAGLLYGLGALGAGLAGA